MDDCVVEVHHHLGHLDAVQLGFFAGTALGGTGRFGSYAAPQITSVTGGVVGSPPAKGCACMSEWG